jgi:hypothetical protein
VGSNAAAARAGNAAVSEALSASKAARPWPARLDAAAPKASPSNVPPAEVVVPKSVFVEPAEPQDDRDPFFPNSPTLLRPPSNQPKQVVAPVLLAELRLKGISGIPAHRLAIINGKTVATGEETMVKTGDRWLRMRCAEVKAQSAIVEIGTERLELRLGPGT